MSGDWDNPVSAILNAVTSTIGWAFAIPCLVYLGLLLGCLCTMQHESMSLALLYLVLLPVLWVAKPLIIPAYIVILWAYWWPLRSESDRAFTTAGIITIVSWALAVWALNA